MSYHDLKVVMDRIGYLYYPYNNLDFLAIFFLAKNEEKSFSIKTLFWLIAPHNLFSSIKRSVTIEKKVKFGPNLGFGSILVTPWCIVSCTTFYFFYNFSTWNIAKMYVESIFHTHKITLNTDYLSLKK